MAITKVDGNLIKDNTIEENNILNSSITANKLAADAVTETKIADGAVTETKIATGVLNGLITEVDSWIISAATDTLSAADRVPISGSWNRMDTQTYALAPSTVGTGLTESGGIFSFPSTGIYMLQWKIELSPITTVSGNSCYVILELTEDDGSTYTSGERIWYDFNSNFARFQQAQTTIVEVSDISNDKFRFITDMAQGSLNYYVVGSTTERRSYFHCTKIRE